MNYEELSISLGASDFLLTPINPYVLRATVRNRLLIQSQSDAIRRLTITDSLTGLLTKRSLTAVIETEWRRAYRSRAPLAIIDIDLDNFDSFLHNYGRETGDECIISIARLLTEHAHRAGDTVFYYGGDEFVIILPETDITGAIKVGESICADVSHLIFQQDSLSLSGCLTASIGVSAIIPTVDADSSSLISSADQALYEAKEAGRNRVAWRTPLSPMFIRDTQMDTTRDFNSTSQTSGRHKSQHND